MGTRTRNERGEDVKRAASLFGIFILLVLTGISFLPGYGPDGPDFDDESLGVPGALRYFKTPQSAVLTISRLLEEEPAALSKFYDLRVGSVDRKTLEDGSYFKGGKHPFPPTHEFFQSRKADVTDIYEIVVRERQAFDDSSDTVFYLKRYPEGYRLLIGRPTEK